MHSETLIFENAQHTKHYVWIAATVTFAEHILLLNAADLLMKQNTSLLKYTFKNRMHHSAYYENEQTPHSAEYKFLKPLKLLLLTHLQLSIVLMYREKLNLQEVMSALGLKEDWLKKLNGQIIKKTGKKEMKNFGKK